MNEYETIFVNMKDPDELEVNYKRSYNNVRMWLIKPVDKGGNGFDASFVDRLMPAVCEKIKSGGLKFETGKEFDLYLRDRCREFEDKVLVGLNETRARLLKNEHIHQQKEGLELFVRLDEDKNKIIKTNKRLWRTIRWLLIIILLQATALTMELPKVLQGVLY